MADQVVSNPKLIEACKLWDKITMMLMRPEMPPRADLDLSNLRPRGNYIYSDNDYRPLACRIDGDKAEMTVGSSPGHATHILLNVGNIRYYDTDRAVNEIMKDLLEAEANVKCTVYEGGVDCEGLKEEKLKELFRVLSMPTSMDLRQEFCREVVGNTEEYCVKREKELFQQIKKAYPP